MKTCFSVVGTGSKFDAFQLQRAPTFFTDSRQHNANAICENQFGIGCTDQGRSSSFQGGWYPGVSWPA